MVSFSGRKLGLCGADEGVRPHVRRVGQEYPTHTARQLVLELLLISSAITMASATSFMGRRFCRLCLCSAR
jgi:hypothetical protein